jgi:formate dehydrogenase accessory protein FdhE
MKPAEAATPNPDYDARIRRAEHLASQYTFAAEVLTFYRRVAAFQKGLCAKLPRVLAGRPQSQPEGQLRSELEPEILLPDFPELLSLLERVGPAPVKEAAREVAKQNSEEWSRLLTAFWMFERRVGGAEQAQYAPAEPLKDFIVRAFLQPYAEFLAARMPTLPLETTYRICPLCGSPPLLGVLRPEGDGAKRFLACSFCLREWEFRRIFCPACGEDAEGKLPVYVVEQFPHIRVESCDTCNFYVRTIDLTKDGHAVVVVDDLSAIPLSLWAHEHGYTRLHANLLGT